MTTKMIEVRDTGTCISALALRLDSANDAERWLLARAGYGVTPDEQRQYVLLMNVDGGAGEFSCDPYGWRTGARTMPVIHKYMLEHFDAIESGQVLDVQFILGETKAPKASDNHAIVTR